MNMEPNTYSNHPSFSEEEKTIFSVGPALMAYLGQVIWGIVLTPVVVGVLILLNVLIKIYSIRYKLTSQRLFIRTGFVSRNIEEIELYRIQDVKVSQSTWQRILGYGTVMVISNDATTPTLYLNGVSHPVKVKEQIRTHVRAARQHVRGFMLMN